MLPPLPSLLIVDDDAHIREIVHAAAERGGIFGTIEEAADGQAALDLIHERLGSHLHLPDFVLSDLSMPRLTGLQLVRELKSRAHTEGIPFAMMTSSNLPNDREDALAAGCCAFFYKPTRMDEFVAMVESLQNLCVHH